MNIKERIEEINAKIKSEHPWVMSVSACLDYLGQEFDMEKTAQRCYDKGFNDPNSKYYQMTIDDILAKWKASGQEATKYGSLLDDYIGLNLNHKEKELEMWKLDNNYDYDNCLRGYCDGFDQFYKALSIKTDYKYAARELPLYIKNENGEYINGRFDCLFYSESLHRYLLIDWKSSKGVDLKNNYGKKMLGPCYDKDDCNGNRYTIQLQMYKKALCEIYNICTPDTIDVYICKMSKDLNSFNTNFELINQNFDYNSDLLNKIIEYSYKKDKIKKSNS